ncbi:MAG TPA: GNAT family N-acetyltransferase [Anaerolineales bacterium]|nr:GNAT family N-acetyltransferase [Anaerolineales bacterium]
MIEIRRIQPHEAAAAKRVIYRVAHEIFHDPRPLEKSILYHESRGELRDMDDIQQNYFENGGIFLVTLDEDQIIGTGAIRALKDDICELKRLWLLTGYHGRGLGYRMIQELFSFAREKGYARIWLQTDAIDQSRALDLYKRLGFREIPRYTERTDDIALELEL